MPITQSLAREIGHPSPLPHPPNNLTPTRRPDKQRPSHPHEWRLQLTLPLHRDARHGGAARAWRRWRDRHGQRAAGKLAGAQGTLRRHGHGASDKGGHRGDPVATRRQGRHASGRRDAVRYGAVRCGRAEAGVRGGGGWDRGDDGGRMVCTTTGRWAPQIGGDGPRRPRGGAGGDLTGKAPPGTSGAIMALVDRRGLAAVDHTPLQGDARSSDRSRLAPHQWPLGCRSWGGSHYLRREILYRYDASKISFQGCHFISGSMKSGLAAWPMFHARSVIQHLNATEREGGGPLHYPANYFTIRNRGSGHLTGAWKWRICFAHFHSEPLQVSVPATFPPMLFLPSDHAPIFGNWYHAGLGRTWVRSLLVRKPLWWSWSLSFSVFFIPSFIG